MMVYFGLICMLVKLLKSRHKWEDNIEKPDVKLSL